MERDKEWDEFLSNLFSCALKTCRSAGEQESLRQHQQMDKLLSAQLTGEQKALVDDALFELSLEAEQRTEALYRQGLRDCIWLLKGLGMLA